MRGEGKLVERYHVVGIRVRGEGKSVWVWRCSLSLCVETRASNSICLSICQSVCLPSPWLKKEGSHVSSQGDG